MSLSGIAVRSDPSRFAEVCEALGVMPGVELHQSDRATGRAVVVLDLPTLAQHVYGLRQIQSVPGVLLAELVCHVADPQEDRAEVSTEALDV